MTPRKLLRRLLVRIVPAAGLRWLRFAELSLARPAWFARESTFPSGEGRQQAINLDHNRLVGRRLCVEDEVFVRDERVEGLVDGRVNYNPTLWRSGAHRYLVYRSDSVDPEEFDWLRAIRESHIEVAELAPDGFTVARARGRLRLEPHRPGGERIEDPRLFTIQGRTFISYVSAEGCGPGATAWIGVVELAADLASPQGPTWWPSIGGNGSPGGYEKNWLFFECSGQSWCLYRTDPCRFYRVDLDARHVHEVIEPLAAPKWESGEPSGGTPPVRVGEEFFSFFHSSAVPPASVAYPDRVYYMGAYAFEARPPFRFTRFTPRPLAVGAFTRTMRNRPVVFPCSAQYDGGTWTIAYGFNDEECRVTTLDHARLLAHCEPL